MSGHTAYSVPDHGTYGGPLVRVVAHYEDGSEVTVDELGVTPVVTMLEAVGRFNDEVIGLPIPDRPRPLAGSRLDWSIAACEEELREFREACEGGGVGEAADAIVDLVYFALGRLIEMGVPPGPVFDAVHAANMQKERGEQAKRPGSLGHDAVKPEGWEPPDHSWLAEVTTARLRAALSDSPTLSEEDRAVLRSLSPAFRQATLVRIAKAQDYRQGATTMLDYFPFGLQSFVQMIHTKDLRLLNLTKTGRTPKHETVLDTAIDMMNYAAFLVEWLTGALDGTRGEGERA